MASNQVSGPGPLSKRTDIGDVQKTQDLPNADYGEQQLYQAQQQGAPMAADTGMAAPGSAGSAGAMVTPLGAPSQRPGEPVTSGANSGAGPDMSSLGLPNQSSQDVKNLQTYLPVLQFMANQQNASWAARNLVRQIKASSNG